ncbi:hypothetical protein [Candidatus Amarolinea dominans]|uniref:hypothetical protein n=1 Tax=Candidatus Amarolinea dominans TaxID=3140696 RepID=UPI003134F6D1|nr:hypothetical protein [Anaerolineae bacterium]
MEQKQVFCGRAEMNRAGWNAVQGTGQVGLIGLVSGRLRGECKAKLGGFALQVLHFTRTELFFVALVTENQGAARILAYQ